MLETWKALLSSRKVWTGTVTVAAIVGSVVLVAMGKIDQSALVPMISAITATGLGVIGSIAWEDAALKGNPGPKSQDTTTTVVTVKPPAEAEPAAKP